MSAILNTFNAVLSAIASLAGGGWFGKIVAVAAGVALLWGASKLLTAVINLVGKIFPGLQININWSRWGNIALIAGAVVIVLVAMGWTGPLPFGLGQVQGGAVHVDTAPVVEFGRSIFAGLEPTRSGLPWWETAFFERNRVTNPATGLPAVPFRFETREETRVEGREIVSIPITSITVQTGIEGGQVTTGTLENGTVITLTETFTSAGSTVTETGTIPVVINPGITRTATATYAVFLENPLLQEGFLREEEIEEPVSDYLQLLAERHVEVGSRYWALDLGEGQPVSWAGRKEFVYSAFALRRVWNRAGLAPSSALSETVALARYNAAALAADRSEIAPAIQPVNQLQYDVQLDVYWIAFRALEAQKAAITAGVITDPAEIRLVIENKNSLLAEVHTLRRLGSDFVPGTDIIALIAAIQGL